MFSFFYVFLFVLLYTPLLIAFFQLHARSYDFVRSNAWLLALSRARSPEITFPVPLGFVIYVLLRRAVVPWGEDMQHKHK